MGTLSDLDVRMTNCASHRQGLAFYDVFDEETFLMTNSLMHTCSSSSDRSRGKPMRINGSGLLRFSFLGGTMSDSKWTLLQVFSKRLL